MGDTDKQDNFSVTLGSDSHNNSDVSEQCDDDIASLEKHLAELPNSRPKSMPNKKGLAT